MRIVSKLNKLCLPLSHVTSNQKISNPEPYSSCMCYLPGVFTYLYLAVLTVGFSSLCLSLQVQAESTDQMCSF